LMLKASSVGELVHALSAKGAKGKVKRTFHNSAYLESRGGLVLLLRGRLRSPMTVNIAAGPDFQEVLSVGQTFDLRPSSLNVGELKIRIGGAPVFRSSLMDAQPINPIGESATAKDATSLKLLYSASATALDLVKGQAFGEFVNSVLRPLARGRLEPLYQLSNYLHLIGNGTGFTPAGDDLVAGFTAAFNHYAMVTGATTLSLPLAVLKKRTVPESALLVDYAQRGYVDEGLEKLILAGLRNRPRQFRTELSELASRGHTSGLDMSLGVLLLVASVGDIMRHGATLESSLQALVN
jgi:hypothetical protein